MVSATGSATGGGLQAVLSRVAALEARFGQTIGAARPQTPGSPALSAGAEPDFAASLSRAQGAGSTVTSAAASSWSSSSAGALTTGFAAPGAGAVRGISALAPGMSGSLASGSLGGGSPTSGSLGAVPGPSAGAVTAPDAVGTGTAGSPTVGAQAVALAKEHLGVPYKWGGTTPAGFDCSGLLQHTFRRLGVELPRVSRDQARAGQPVASLAEARPGDLVAFGHPVDHIGIYAGDNTMVVAPRTGAVVRVQEITRPVVAIRRVV